MGRPRLPIGLKKDMKAYVDTLAEPTTERPATAGERPTPDSSWMRSMRHRLRHHRPAGTASHPRTIFRVPTNIRKDQPLAYTPTVVSVGPLHYSPLQLTYVHKWRCVRRLLAWFGGRSPRKVRRLFSRCLAEMSSLEPAARSCYDDELSLPFMSPHDFTEMLLLDGCFILYVLVREKKGSIMASSGDVDVGDGEKVEEEEDGSGDDLVERDDEEEVRIEGDVWIWILVKYDLLKLENQIPFFVIEALYNGLHCHALPSANLVDLARGLFADIHPSIAASPIAVQSGKVHHLLHLFHLSLLPRSLATSLPSAGGLPTAMLPEWIPSATELSDAGVRFRRSKQSSSFLEVKFERGVMDIPPLHVYKYSDAVFRNLIALEQCLPVQPYVTVYALFMNCMARTAADVRLLQLSGILLNTQCADGEVAKLFNRLCGKVHYANESNYLRGLFVEVRQYHESRWHNWWAALVRNYFGSPWVIMSVVAAAFLLLLTVEQAFFAAYAYFNPPN